MAVQHAWRERLNFLVVPYVLVPQPEEFVREGVSFVVLLQNPQLGQMPVGRGQILTLTAVQMSQRSASSAEGPITVYRGGAMPGRLREDDIIEKHDLQSICHPTGRRPCHITLGDREIGRDPIQAIDGNFIRVNVGPESALPVVQRAFQAFAELRSQLFSALPREGSLSVRLITFGHRYVHLGNREHVFEMTNAWYPSMLADQIFADWPNQPVQRARVFRVRALDTQDVRSNQVVVNLLIGFDLRPGNVLALALNDQFPQGHFTLEGPELLSPHLWSLGYSGESLHNPLTESNYAINFVDFAQPNNRVFCQSGDIVVFVDAPNQAGNPSQTNDEQSLLQLPSQNFVEELRQHEQIQSNPDEAERQAPLETNPAQAQGRKCIELFPLLADDLPCHVNIEGSAKECKAFLQACRHLKLRAEIPPEIFEACPPVSKAYLETCEPIAEPKPCYHVYTDGSAHMQITEGHKEREATWAGIVFKVKDKKREFVGWVGGTIPQDSSDVAFLGHQKQVAIDAERTAVFWLLAWSMSLPAHSHIVFHVDSQAAGFGADGSWRTELTAPLAVKVRELAQIVQFCHALEFEHVKAHTLQPQNELVDSAAGLVSEIKNPTGFGQPSLVQQIANFDQYKTMWFWLNREGALPNLEDNKLRVQMKSFQPSHVPDLIKGGDATGTPSPEVRCTIELSFASYNVMTLRAGDATKKIDEDSTYFGKIPFLKQQMIERRLHFLVLQECRSREDGVFENQEICRIVAAGTKEGTHGVELWINKKLPLGFVNDKPIFFNSSKATVRSATANLLIVRLEILGQSFVIFNCHGPQSGQQLESRETWWTAMFEEINKIKAHEKVIIAGDMNARLHASCRDQVGDLICSKSNPNSHLFYGLLDALPDFIVPSTHSKHHNGPSATWRHSSGSLSRLDYFVLKPEQWTHFRTTAWPMLDAGNAIFDHFPIGLTVRCDVNGPKPRPKKTPIDWAQIRDPRNRKKICLAITEIPVASWDVHPTDQVHWLTQDIDNALRRNFPLKGLNFVQPYMTAEAWALRQKRKRLMKNVRSLHKDSKLTLLRLGFLSLCNRSPSEVLQESMVPLCVELSVAHALRDTAKALKNEMKKLRADFVDGMAERVNLAQSNEVFQELKRIRFGSKFCKKGTTPLPLWRSSTGEAAEDHQQRAEMWRLRCSQLEVGNITTAKELCEKAHQRQAKRLKGLPPPSFAELPSLLEIEEKLKKLKRNKAPGNDELRSEICQAAAVPLARHVHSLASKFVVTMCEPMQYKGGSLVSAYKNSGARDDITNFRSLLLSAHLGKVTRSWLRDKLMPIYAANSAESHFAAKKGGNVAHAATLLKAIIVGAKKRKRSFSALFVDISSAFYRVVRELVINLSSTDQEVINILERFGLGPKHFEQLQRQLARPPILEQCECTQREQATVDAILSDTWYTVPFSNAITATSAGSRPGDTFADLIFSFVYSNMLSEMRQALQGENFRTADHLQFDPSFRSTCRLEVSPEQAPDFLDLTWADDLVIVQHHDDSQVLLSRASLAAGLLNDLCAKRGMQINYKKGKTECLLQFHGAHSKAMRLKHFAAPNPQIQVPSMFDENLTIRLTHQYKHLGSQVHIGLKQMQEVKYRVGQAWQVYNKYRQTVFQNPRIALKIRTRLLQTMVLSVLTFNQGNWRTLQQAAWNCYAKAVRSFYRGLLRRMIPHEELQFWSHERVEAYLKMPNPQALLHSSRLRYLGALWRSAPLVLWWHLHYEGEWYAALEKALAWLQDNTKGLQAARQAEYRAQHWHLIVPNRRQWKSLIRTALDHDVETSRANEFLSRWHFDFVNRAIEAGVQLEAGNVLLRGLESDSAPASAHSHGCIACQTTFASRTSWFVHAFRRHGRIAPERRAITDSICRCCQKNYSTTARLLRHLRYSPQCALAMEAARENDDVNILPGIGNSQVDQERDLPLPVFAVEGEKMSKNTDQVLRPDIIPELLVTLKQELKQAAAGQNPQEGFEVCLDWVRSSFEDYPNVRFTIEYLQDSLLNEDLVTLDELTWAPFALQVIEKLKEATDFAVLFNEQTQDAKPHEMRTATFKGVEQLKNIPCKWNAKDTVPRMRTKQLLILHVFAGHRRTDDVCSFIEGFQAPDGTGITLVPVDIIYDPIRCDVSREDIQARWMRLAAIGAILGMLSGPPCETFTSARALGGLAGLTEGDGGPRQIRTGAHPYGVEAMRVDERRHVHLSNVLLGFTYDMCILLLRWIHSFFMVEHPDIPEPREGFDLPSSWNTGACKIIQSHPAVSMHHIAQGKFGARSPKPTLLMTKGLVTLKYHLACHGTQKLPPALPMGRQADGSYATAELKAYPAKLCRAIGSAVMDFLRANRPSMMKCEIEDPSVKAWADAILTNSNFMASMGTDRAGVAW